VQVENGIIINHKEMEYEAVGLNHLARDMSQWKDSSEQKMRFRGP
jgi:hypothetical protein